ncbi:FAD binding domain-containing protein [Paenibacillus tarimensis]|uniref:FAD binding domain-containing protein n=1 Tax=Paenibacillus tarimensis TaxID=416012 RepID=UPI001F332A3D|nr:FAD binding domain-containing protein [Paenibacillus tarimensis]MCF2944732.1 FAD binding domain-containing protein [Paenibacillus tarimensis]
MQEYRTSSPAVWYPNDIAEAWRMKEMFAADGQYIAGGTLLRTWWESGTAVQPRHLISLNRIPGLSDITLHEQYLIIGSQTSLSEIRYNIAAALHAPLLVEACKVIAAPPVRNLATIGGNISSRVGDSLPALLAHHADLLWFNGSQTEAVPLEIWLAEAGTDTDAAALLTHIRIPLLDVRLESAEPDCVCEGECTCRGEAAASLGTRIKRLSAYDKVGRREIFTPSVVTTSVSGQVSDGGRLANIRIAAGGGQTPPSRLRNSEAVLEGRMLGDAGLLFALYEAVYTEFEPVGDVFAGAEYRRLTAAGLLSAAVWKSAKEMGWGEELTCC